MKPGRKSSAELSLTAIGNSFQQRMQPPGVLTPRQKDEWLAVTERLPADWFPRECAGLLANYVRLVEALEMIAIQLCEISQADLRDPDGLDAFERLTTLQEKQGRALASLACKLRISPSSRYQANQAHAKAKDPAPAEANLPWRRVA